MDNKEGRPCMIVSDQKERRRQHFSKVLNVQRQYDKEELSRVRQRPIEDDLG